MVLSHPLHPQRCTPERKEMKVHGGETLDHTKSLCETCRHSGKIYGHAISQSITYCHYMAEKIKWPISRCSMWEQKGALTIQEMEKMAYILEDRQGKIGFRRLTKEERNDY